nr:hypothetical protein [Tanacetum cinerariifolium]
MIIFDLNKTPDLFQKPPQNCPKCENQHCQGCALLQKKFKENLFTYCEENGILQCFLDTSESSYDNTNVVNALQEPFVVKQNPKPCNNQTNDELPQTLQSFDPTCYSEDRNSFTYDSKSNLVDDSPNNFNPHLQPLTYSYEFCGNDAYYGHDCPLQVPFTNDPEPIDQSQPPHFPVIHQPIREKTCAKLLAEEQEANINTQPFQYSVVHQPLREEISVLSLAWETILEIELAFEDKHCQPEDILQLFRRLHNDVKNIHEKLAVYMNTLSLDRPTICYNDDDEEDCTIAITPILSIEDPDNSLSMGDKHLDTISATESDELIKSSVKNLVPIAKFSDSNDDSTSIDDDSFSIDDIEYVEASPPDSVLISSEVLEIVIPKVGGIDVDILVTIKDDILREKLLKINLLIANIEALKDKNTPSFDFMTKSSSTSLNFLLQETNTFDNSLPESETFCFDLEEISSGSTTTHSDSSLYDSFIFNLSINPFPPAGSSDVYEFADELAHIIPPTEYDCFWFKNEPNSGDFTIDVVEDIFPTIPTHPTFQLNLDFILSSESLFAYVVWIFLLFLSYSVAP